MAAEESSSGGRRSNEDSQRTENPPDEGGRGHLGFVATWSMAVGGMVGGGIYTVLGVAIESAGSWFWLSFVVGGLIAWLSASSYAALATHYREGGGAFAFLREEDRSGLAGGLSWILVVGYVLTMSVYAYTFGHYLAHAFGGSTILARLGALAIVSALVALNLRGAAKAAIVEIALVWGGITILLALAAVGIGSGDPTRLGAGLAGHGPMGALIGAGSVFMAYEGFQLLSYDYGEIRDPQRTLPRALAVAVPSVIVVYVAVGLGAVMLVGPTTLIDKADVSLAVAGQAAFGWVGSGLVVLAAALSTGSAINSTLFATARLVDRVASDGELPAGLDHASAAGVPDRAIVLLGAAAAALAVLGRLSALVESASLAFLATFAVVGFLAARRADGRRALYAVGGAGAVAVAGILVVQLAMHRPWVLGLFALLALLAFGLRPILLRRTTAQS